MVGLRTQENEKFNRFFALIQAEAEKKDSVFFADAGDGNEFATSTMEGEDMMGWLVPKEKVEEFEGEAEVEKVVVEEVLEKEYVNRGKVNRVEVII